MDLERPLPTPITPECRPYWEGARDGKLMITKCRACGKPFMYPRVSCPFCASRDIGWVQASGRGRLFSFEIAHQILNKAFKVKTPVVLAMVELRGRTAASQQSGRRRAGSQADPLRHAGRGLLREAHGRDQLADVPPRGRCAMSDLARLRELSNTACIVGVDESDEIGTLPGKSQLTLHVEAITNAARDAGIKVSEIDGIFTAGQHSPATIGEAIGVVPRYVDGTTVGGCSFIIMVGRDDGGSNA